MGKFKLNRGKKNRIALLLGFCFVLVSVSAQQLSTTEALASLKDGNKRYINGKSSHPHQNQHQRDITWEEGQHPFATIIACSDSRVPVELVFDVGIGDVFSIRIAGNVCDIDEVGSIEYGIAHLGTPVLVILGHSSCGAVTAVTRGDEVHGSIPALVDNIAPAVELAKHKHGSEFSEELLNAAIENNVWQSIEDLLTHSPDARDLVKKGNLVIEGAIYDLHTGEVKWLGHHPKEKKLLSSHGSYGGQH
nr:carbonic anhydrase [uncultured Carboxylicivirga sp.]